MDDAGFGEPAILQHGHPLPAHPVLLAAPPKHVPPQARDVKAEGRQGGEVGRDGVIGIEAPHHLFQPAPLCIDRLVHAAAQRLLDRPQGGAHAIDAGLPF